MNLLALLLVTLPFLGVLADHGAIQGRHNIARHQEVAGRSEGHLQKRFMAKWTWYDGNTGNKGACGDWVVNDRPTVAMNRFQFNPSECGKTITLTRGGVTRQAQITDMCPRCPFGGLDLTPSLFSAFASRDIGEIHDGNWEYGAGQPPEKPKVTTTPPKKVVPSTTRKPPPPPSSTPKPTTRTTTRPRSSTTPAASSTRRMSSSVIPRSSSIPASSSAPDARPTSELTTPEAPGSLEALNQAILAFGSVAVYGAGAT